MNKIAFLVDDAAAGGFTAHGIGADIHLAADARLPVRLYVCSTRTADSSVLLD